MDWMEILRLFAATTTVAAAVMVALNWSARVTVLGFVVFIAASIAWMVDGWLEGKASLLIQNAVLLLVNIAGVYRWLPRVGILSAGCALAHLPRNAQARAGIAPFPRKHLNFAGRPWWMAATASAKIQIPCRRAAPIASRSPKPGALRWPRRASVRRAARTRPASAMCGACSSGSGVVQIDSVNVLARAHTLPAFSRLGRYRAADLHALAYGGRKRALFEYWGHEASLLPVALQPLLRWRMARAARGEGIYGAHRAVRPRAAGADRAGAPRDRRARTAGRRRAVASAQGRGRLVGLVGGQARGRVAVLGRRGDDGDAARHLRARVRPHRAGAAAIRDRDADAGRGRCPARAAAHLGAVPGRRHRALPARLLSSGSRRCQAAHRRAGRGGRAHSDDRARAGTGSPISAATRGGPGAWRRRRCWRRSIR